MTVLDDILDRLRSTLPAPNTCDLIDINPGRGIWSQRLHAVLKPRRHVLLEPNLPAYSDYLQPLLNLPDSKYRHATLIRDVLDPGNGLLSEYDANLGRSSTNAPQYNPLLLLTANLAGQNLKIANYVGSPSRRFLDDLFLSLGRARNDLNRYGLVRVLAWIPDDEKDAYLPRTVSARRKQAVLLETSHTITEVAGAPSDSKSTRYRKWPEIELEDIARVQGKQDAAGIKTPATRRTEGPHPRLLSVTPDPTSIREASFTSDAAWVPRFLELDDRLRNQYPEWYQKALDELSSNLSYFTTPEQKDWSMLLRRAKTAHKTHMEAVDIIKQERALRLEWNDLLLKSKDGSLEPSVETRLQNAADGLDVRLHKLSRTNRKLAEKAIDDYRAFDLSPPAMSWNRRKIQPLIVHDGEFHPRRRLAFLDVVPNPWFVSKVDTYDKQVCFNHVVKSLYFYFTKSVNEGLKSLVHEGVEDFAKTIPGIHDPTKAGWYDLNSLRLRSLPVEMFVEIALAYEKWPFRLSTEAILMLTQDPQAAYRYSDD